MGDEDAFVHVGSDDEFERLIQTHPLVVVDFTATWCGPCKRMAATLIQDVLPKVGGAVKVLKVDVDECRSLARRLGIEAMPTLFLYIRGSRVLDPETQQPMAIVGWRPDIGDRILEVFRPHL
jgi:thioredoxin 1